MMKKQKRPVGRPAKNADVVPKINIKRILSSNSFQKSRAMEDLLPYLQEFSSAGFVLITTDQEGNPVVYPQFDNSMSTLALAMFGRVYFGALAAQLENTIANGGMENEDDGGGCSGFDSYEG